MTKISNYQKKEHVQQMIKTSPTFGKLKPHNLAISLDNPASRLSF